MPNPEFNTLEEARAEIIRLNEEISKRDVEIGNYSTRVNELSDQLETVRNLNQEYFLKLQAQKDTKTEDEDDDHDVPSCEDFARTLTI